MQQNSCNNACKCAYLQQINDLKEALNYYRNTLTTHLHLVDKAMDNNKHPDPPKMRILRNTNF